MKLDKIKLVYFSSKTLREAAKILKMQPIDLADIRDKNGWPKRHIRDMAIKRLTDKTNSIYSCIETGR
jgi:hypothetical protein